MPPGFPPAKKTKTGKMFIPQDGFQTRFLSTGADIAFGGGAAGAGKTYGLLLEQLRHIENSGFSSVIFRRTMPQIKYPGGLWDESETIFSSLAARPFQSSALWKFASGAEIKFSSLQHLKDIFNFMGSQIPLISFDELTHFHLKQFEYLMTRNRSSCGVKPYMRATMNPQSDGWVKSFIGWYLYPDTYEIEALRGFPIPERADAIRYFTKHKNEYVWGENPESVIDKLPESARGQYYNEDVGESDNPKYFIKSFTFIPGTLADNPLLLKSDPMYKSNLLAQDEEIAEQLLSGRWYSRGGADILFDRMALGDAFTNTFVQGGHRYITADVAFEGSDLFVIVVWEGWRIVEIAIFERSDGQDIVEQLKKKAYQYGVRASRISVDAAGVGMFLRGFFKTSFNFVSNAQPIKVNRTIPKFANLYTQCIYWLSTKIEERELFFGEGLPQKAVDRIMQEFPEFKRAGFDNSGRILATSKSAVKEKLGFSPDLFDAIIQRAIFDLLPGREFRRATV